MNFDLDVAGITTTVEVTGVAESMLLETGSSTGTVMQEQLVSELPLVGNNVMELLNTMGGVIRAEEPIFGASTQSFAGVTAGAVNITRDGVPANEVRYTSGINPASYLNQELVGEFKMILSPVDAELGRGAGQVQITTRSGSNAFHGSGVWNNQNTVLDAEKFEDKRIGVTPPWRNVNNYTLSASGPIIKNKTFFFVSWDQQIVRNKSWATVNALTNCARKGIYRYYDGVISRNPNDNADRSFQEGMGFPYRQVVKDNYDGTPNLSDKPANSSGQLMYQSIFGPLDYTAKIQVEQDLINCSAYNPASVLGTTDSWNADRATFDATGYVSKYLELLPEANYFGHGDSLNTAAFQWWRTTAGSNNIYGTGEDNRRKVFTVKIDHNISSAHRLSGTYTYETNAGEDGGPAWPENSYIGRNWRKPQNLALSLTSTLAPTLLNEFRFGYSRLTGYVMSSIDSSDGKLAPILNNLTSGMSLSNYRGDLPVVVSYDGLAFGPGSNYIGDNMNISSPFASRGVMNNTWGGTDTRWTVADTVTWMKGAHSFKGGFEVRLPQAWYKSNGEGGFMSTSYVAPLVTGGDSSSSPISRDGWMWDGIPHVSSTVSGLSSSNSYSNQGGIVNNMLQFLSGSVTDVRQYFYIVKNGSNYRWNDINANENEYITDIRNREFSAFFKDDWKVTNDLTLNLGVRYEYYGVPWNDTGMTVGLRGGSSSILGQAGSAWMNWLGISSNAATTEYEFIGPGSDNPDRSVWNKDMNNFAPHVGFAWQLPWLGKGLTTLRGGYSISYSPLNNFDGYKGIIATVPGTAIRYTDNTSKTYFNLANISDVVGTLYPTTDPMATITGASQTMNIYDENIRTPYTQSLNLSLTRQIGRALTLDVRYIGTLARKQLSAVNLNTSNYRQNDLYKEFDIVRAKGGATLESEIPKLTEILRQEFLYQLGIFTIPQYLTTPYMLFNTNDYSNGAGQLANGDYSGLATNIAISGSCGLNCYGSNIALSTLDNNFIFTNPQFYTANLFNNEGYTNYHSMQAQVTMRPVRGLSFQASYTWSRAIMDQGIGDYSTGARRYYLAGHHRSHALTSYGSYELPFGPNGFLLRDASGAFRKAIEGWGLSWVANITSGAPASLMGTSSLWGIGNPVVERWDLWDNKAGKVEYNWNDKGIWEPASFYGNRFVKIPDPVCSTLAPDVAGNCTLKALALASDPATIVVRNARPGEIGNLTPNSLTSPGRWTLDMAMSKSVEFLEGKRVEFRVDAANIFNHATPSGSADSFNHAPRYDVINPPEFGLNGNSPLGYIATKAGHRTFQAKVRVSF
jgi:hypothetical protein